MKNLRNILIFITIGLMIVVLFYMDFSNLSWTNNHSDFIGLITGLLLIGSMLLSNSYERKQAK